MFQKRASALIVLLLSTTAVTLANAPSFAATEVELSVTSGACLMFMLIQPMAFMQALVNRSQPTDFSRCKCQSTLH